MSIEVYFENNLFPHIGCIDLESLKQKISQQHVVPVQDLYVTINGKAVSCNVNLCGTDYVVRVCRKSEFEKISFLSMLRGIEGQIRRKRNLETNRGHPLKRYNLAKSTRKGLDVENRRNETTEQKQKHLKTNNLYNLKRLRTNANVDADLVAKYEGEQQRLSELLCMAVDAGWKVAETSGNAGRTQNRNEKKKRKLRINGVLLERSPVKDNEEVRVSSCAPHVSSDNEQEASDSE